MMLALPVISIVGAVIESSPKAGNTRKMKRAQRRLKIRTSLFFIDLSPGNTDFHLHPCPVNVSSEGDWERTRRTRAVDGLGYTSHRLSHLIGDYYTERLLSVARRLH